MVKRVSRAAGERPEAFAGVPKELERWARGDEPARHKSRRGGTRTASAPARRTTAPEGAGLSGMVPDALSGEMGGLAAAAAVGLGAALIEAELLPGIVLGAGAMLLGKMFPQLNAAMRPLLKSAVGAGLTAYDKTRAAVADASENVRDVFAEVQHERKDSASSRQPTTRRTRRAAKRAVQEGASQAAASALPEAAEAAV